MKNRVSVPPVAGCFLAAVLASAASAADASTDELPDGVVLPSEEAPPERMAPEEPVPAGPPETAPPTQPVPLGPDDLDGAEEMKEEEEEDEIE